MNPENIMNPEVKAAWVAALRSGEYKQGYMKLYNQKEQTYCCLGVLCQLYANEKGIAFGEVTEPWSVALTPSVRDWAGLRSVNPYIRFDGNIHDAMSLNDNEKLTFPQIADLIEKNL
jgi:hypothetical protein